jgi:hypothetical protein
MSAFGLLVSLLAVAVAPGPDLSAPDALAGRTDPNHAVSREDEARNQPPPVSDAHCPYRFGSEMPPGVFCVYQGTAFGPDGGACAKSVWVIWSSYAGDATTSPAGVKSDADDGTVAIGFLSDPEMVFRGAPDRADSNRAGFVGYFVGDEPEMHPSVGSATLHESGDAQKAGGRLSVTFTGSEIPTYDGCPLAKYEGRLMGVLGTPEKAPPRRLVLRDE